MENNSKTLHKTKDIELSFLSSFSPFDKQTHLFNCGKQFFFNWVPVGFSTMAPVYNTHPQNSYSELSAHPFNVRRLGEGVNVTSFVPYDVIGDVPKSEAEVPLVMSLYSPLTAGSSPLALCFIDALVKGGSHILQHALLCAEPIANNKVVESFSPLFDHLLFSICPILRFINDESPLPVEIPVNQMTWKHNNLWLRVHSKKPSKLGQRLLSLLKSIKEGENAQTSHVSYNRSFSPDELSAATQSLWVNIMEKFVGYICSHPKISVLLTRLHHDMQQGSLTFSSKGYFYCTTAPLEVNYHERRITNNAQIVALFVSASFGALMRALTNYLEPINDDTPITSGMKSSSWDMDIDAYDYRPYDIGTSEKGTQFMYQRGVYPLNALRMWFPESLQAKIEAIGQPPETEGVNI